MVAPRASLPIRDHTSTLPVENRGNPHTHTRGSDPTATAKLPTAATAKLQNKRDSGAGASRTPEPLYAQPPASTPGSEGRATGHRLRRSSRASRSAATDCDRWSEAGNRAATAGSDHPNARACIRTTTRQHPRKRGTSDRTGPPAIRRAHRAEGECAIAGSEERAGLIGTKPGRWT